MYLSLLNEQQKIQFMSLAYNLASSDGDFSESEKQAIEAYSQEMQLEFKIEEVDTDINRVLNKLENLCGIREKKIIIFELIGLAMADSNYDEGERAIVSDALSIFDINADFGIYCERKLNEYLNLQNDLNENILA